MQCGGWIYADNDWYYLDTDGTMWYGGWKDIDNKRYYLSNGGRMRSGWLYTDDNWYYLGQSGSMRYGGWVYADNDWYYLDTDGTMWYGGWKDIDNKRYYLSNGGRMRSGWLYTDDNWYYLGQSGSMRYGGWIYADSDWYYLDTDGTMWYGGWKDINNKRYYLSNGGRMRTGWQYIDDKWYFLNSSGAMQTGWLYRGTENDREIWYYLHSSGSMKQGLQYINDKWYYFESNGRWVSNWEFLKNTGSMVQTSAEFVETLIKIARGDYGNTNYGDKYHVNGGGRSIGAWNSEIEAFMFDCSGVLKSVLWGWNGNKSGIYGGAVYCSNKVPDINDQGFHDVSEMHDITDINEIPTGALLWKQGHVGCYIGNGETIECTVQGDGTVQFGTVTSDGTRTVSNNVVEKWTQWGKIPYINYEISTYVS